VGLVGEVIDGVIDDECDDPLVGEAFVGGGFFYVVDGDDQIVCFAQVGVDGFLLGRTDSGANDVRIINSLDDHDVFLGELVQPGDHGTGGVNGLRWSDMKCAGGRRKCRFRLFGTTEHEEKEQQGRGKGANHLLFSPGRMVPIWAVK